MSVKAALPVNQTRSWNYLKQLKKGVVPDLRGWFQQEPGRGRKFSIRTEKIYYDFSRQLVTPQILKGLCRLAEEVDLKSKIQAMFSGEKINLTEGRAVLHTALRYLPGLADPQSNHVYADGKNVMPEVKAVLDKIQKFSAEVMSGQRTGVTGRKIKNIVAIGIGGSYLGPEYLAEVCQPFAQDEMKLVFVANVDGADFTRKTAGLDPEETMVVVISKTFTTAETMLNAKTARDWMLGALSDQPKEEVIKKHFIAVSTAEKLVREFGIDPENMFGFWDWVGGRFSATSAVGGLPLSLFLGYENFQKILEGAYWMDRHFRETPLENNIPVIAALTDIWNINFLGLKTRAILPYSQAWSRYSAHCQQVEMESNGKAVDIFGRSVDHATGEVVFGEPGTNGQHSFYQLLHQGTEIVPADFIGFIRPQGQDDKAAEHHNELMANFFAQPNALAFGKTAEEALADFIEGYKNKNSGAEPTPEAVEKFKQNLLPHKIFPGNRPSNIFLLGNQEPFEAGLLLALLEHRAAVKGFVWRINSFDQFGVELGKKLGVDIRERMEKFRENPADPAVFDGLDRATALELKFYLEGGF